MKKSLIKSLLPVLVVALVLSLATISVMADAVKGYYYCPEKEGCTYYVEYYDGLGRTGEALPESEATSTYNGLGRTGEALEAAEATGAYDGLGRTGEALEAAEAVGTWDGFHVFTPADCDDKPAADIDGLA